MIIKYSSAEEVKKAAMKFLKKGKDIAVNTKDFIITIYN